MKTVNLDTILLSKGINVRLAERLRVNFSLCLFLVNFGKKHPDPVVETSSLSSVEPPDIKYQLRILDECVDEDARLSALQLESITYASQRHQTILPNGQRAGYLIG